MIGSLGEVFDMKNMGKLTFFLGFQITYKDNGDVFISLSKYVKDLLKNVGLESCKPHTQLLEDEGTPLADPKVFQSLAGALQYLTFTHPYIAFAVTYACQFMATPIESHLALVKRILKYLQDTISCGLTCFATSQIELQHLVMQIGHLTSILDGPQLDMWCFWVKTLFHSSPRSKDGCLAVLQRLSTKPWPMQQQM